MFDNMRQQNQKVNIAKIKILFSGLFHNMQTICL